MSDEKTVEKIYGKILKRVENRLGKSRTNTSQLAHFGRHTLGNEFTGVFPIDKIRPCMLNSYSPYAILNLDDSNSKGSHWIAVARRSDGKFVIYDSFGRQNERIVPSLMYFDLVSTDDDSEQCFTEDNCGQRSLAWLIYAQIYGLDSAMKI